MASVVRFERAHDDLKANIDIDVTMTDNSTGNPSTTPTLHTMDSEVTGTEFELAYKVSDNLVLNVVNFNSEQEISGFRSDVDYTTDWVVNNYDYSHTSLGAKYNVAPGFLGIAFSHSI